MNPRTTRVDQHPGAKDELCAPHMFTHGHARQLASVARAHLVNLVGHSGLLPGLEDRVFIDIDSLLRPVYGHQKQGASYGHTKIAGKQVLRKASRRWPPRSARPRVRRSLPAFGCARARPVPARVPRRW